MAAATVTLGLAPSDVITALSLALTAASTVAVFLAMDAVEASGAACQRKLGTGWEQEGGRRDLGTDVLLVTSQHSTRTHTQAWQKHALTLTPGSAAVGAAL